MEAVTPTNFCRTCGTRINSEAVCANCGCPPYNGNAYCNNCGSETLPNAVMCPKCKNYFPSADAIPYVDTYEDLGVNGTSSKKGWVIGGIALVAVVISIFFMSNSGSKESKTVAPVSEEGWNQTTVESSTSSQSSSTVEQQPNEPPISSTIQKKDFDQYDIRGYSKSEIMHLLSLKTFESADGSVSLKFHENGTFEYYSGVRLEEDAGGFVKGDYGKWQSGTYSIGEVFKRDFTSTSSYFYSVKISGSGPAGQIIPLELHQKFLSDGTSESSWELVNDMDVKSYFKTFVLDVFPDQEKYIH